MDLATPELAGEVNKPIIAKLGKRKVYSSFIDNIWGADIADMQLIRKYNKGICFMSCAIDISVNIYGLFLWRIKKVLQILMLSKNSNRKSNKIWVDKVVNFKIDQCNSYKIMILKHIQYITKENVLLLKDLLES